MSIAKSDYTQKHGTTEGLAVVTHSSGNHAMALSLAAKTFGVPAHIVMPKSSPHVKQESVRGYGGRITLCEHPPEEVSIIHVQHLLQSVCVCPIFACYATYACG